MSGHSEGCDGHCGWTRTYCELMWKSFFGVRDGAQEAAS